MELDHVQARIRPRRPWEAVDLGFAMVAQWRGPVYRAWVAAALPVFLLVGALGYRHPWIAALILWWLKPLLDRVPLHVLSRALFGELPAWRPVMREVPRLWRRGTFRALFGDRFNPARSFTMPVDQLEAPRGPLRRARLKVICHRHWEEGMRLTITSCAAEFALVFALLAALAFLLPEGLIMGQVEAFFSEYDEAIAMNLGHFWLAAQMLSILLVEPLYVAAGFCLYLNRRTQLEAWDIEVAFRRLGARLAGRAAAIAMLILAALLGPGAWADGTDGQVSTQAPAAAPAPATAPSPTSHEDAVSSCVAPGCQEAGKVIAQVLDDQVFGSTRRETRWHLRRPGAADPSADKPWLASLGSALGAAFEPVLWCAACLCLAAFFIMKLNTGAGTGTLALDGAETAEVLGLDLRRRSLPDDIPGEARRLHLEGESAAAVSLLFRGALAELALGDRVPFRKGMTEGECVRLARRAVEPARAGFFESLASAWTAVAYGHRTLPAGRVDDLIAEWVTHFRSVS